MIIEIYCVSSSRDVGKPTQMSGCGIVFIATNGVQSKKRSMSFGLGMSSVNIANVQVVRLALASILPPFRKVPISIHITNKYIAELLQKIGSNYVIENDKDDIKDMRKWADYYFNLSLILDVSKDRYMVEAKQLAKLAINDQKITDSDTIDII